MSTLLSGKKPILLLLLLTGVFFLVLCLFSGVTYDVGDGIRHYMVSRYSWKHHGLLMYSWGKPFFSLLSSPFSQFGMTGINVFNILCGVLSAWYCYLIAKKLSLHHAWLVIPFLFFAPVYFPTMNSGLTEPFFGLVLIASVHLMLSGRYWQACLLVSFLPFVRTEGNLILPFFIVILAWRRKILLAPLLGAGTLIYSIAGYFYYDDFLWIINQNPYNGANKDFYGKGELLHFVKNYDQILGFALTLLFCIGLVAILIRLLRARKERVDGNLLPEEIFLVYGPFLIYFVAHSIMWWKGLANSLGLLRVLAAVAPCAALVCLRGLNLLLKPLRGKIKWLEYGVIAVALFFVLRSPFTQPYFPFRMDPAEQLMKNVSEWYKSSPFAKKPVFCAHPFLVYELGLDPFNEKTTYELGALLPIIKKYGAAYIPDSTSIFWDAHFGPNECRLPKDSIAVLPDVEPVKFFQPEKLFLTFAGDPFEVLVFMKCKKYKPQALDSAFYDLENLAGFTENLNTISSEKAFSGKQSIRLSPEDEYSLAFTKDISALDGKWLMGINFSARFSGKKEDLKEAMVVVSVSDKEGKQTLFWQGEPLAEAIGANNPDWEPLTFHFTPTFEVGNGSSLKIYIWNKAKKTFFVDDVSISYEGKK
jgi:hypothetical protein